VRNSLDFIVVIIQHQEEIPIEESPVEFAFVIFVLDRTQSFQQQPNNMSQQIDQADTFCYDCVYVHHYKINPCSHTICHTCLNAAVAEKIRLKRETFICPRCTDSEERRNRLEKIAVMIVFLIVFVM
jgi:hypothetical protein